MALLPADQLGVHVDASWVRFGILLPEVSPAAGCSVEVRLIHSEDQFLQDIPFTGFALGHGQLAPWGDFWSLELPLSDPFFLRPGTYVYRYAVRRQWPAGGLIQCDFLSDPFAREFSVARSPPSAWVTSPTTGRPTKPAGAHRPRPIWCSTNSTWRNSAPI